MFAGSGILIGEGEESLVQWRAECCCGQLSATCLGEPVRVSVCHCLACKRRTGGAFSFNARFRADAVSIEGRARKFVRIGGSGVRSTYSFCPICGITIYYQSDAERDLSPYPERALKAGDALVHLAPDAGHLVHMPTHIDVLCGDYQSVVERNHAANRRRPQVP